MENEKKHEQYNFFKKSEEKFFFENALNDSDDRWKFAIEGSDLGLWDWNTETNKLFYSKKWKEMLGYEEHEIGDSFIEWSSRVHPDDIERCYEDLNKHLKKETLFYSNEHRVKCKDGDYKWVHDRGKVVHWNEDGKPIRMIGTHADISNRKAIEEILRQERDMFISGPVVTFKWKNAENWPVEYISPNFEQILGYNSEEFLLNRILYTEIIHPDDLNRVINEVDTFSTSNVVRFEHQPYRLISRSGEIKWVLDYTTILRDDSGKITHFLGYIVDISERKTAEEKIHNSLKEKEILLKEIHHRVKNNLQFIVSLLSLQEDLIKDESILGIFQDVQNRIRSMAIMYEHMYKTSNFETVDIRSYVDNLVKYLYNIYVQRNEAVSIDIDIDEFELDMDTIIPCGLIINELFSNSLKYAFSPGSAGRISILLKSLDGFFTLIVSDNGAGLPENFNIDNLKSLGLRLVKIFVTQLRGTMEIYRPEKGVEFKIQFKNSKNL